jgi:chemosensory pili system protein ChpA (sensor histidine kinase/response regulator)
MLPLEPDPISFKSNKLTPEDLEVIRAFLAADDFASSPPDDGASAIPASDERAGLLDGTGEDDEMLSIFATEVDEDIADMQRALDVLRRDARSDALGSPPSPTPVPVPALAALAALRRSTHKIRGTSAAIGCHAMSTIAHAVESLVGLARSRRIALHTGLLALGHAVDALKATLESVVMKGQESILPLLSLEERFAELQLPLRGLRARSGFEGDEPDEIEEPLEEDEPGEAGDAAYPDLESRLDQLLPGAAQAAVQRRLTAAQADARQEVEAALANLRSAQARLQHIEAFVATAPSMPTTPAAPTTPPSGAGHALPSIEELAPSSLVARILRESEQRIGHVYQPRPRAAHVSNALAETMLLDDLEPDHLTDARTLARSLNEAIADLATATAQLQQALALLDALVSL